MVQIIIKDSLTSKINEILVPLRVLSTQNLMSAPSPWEQVICILCHKLLLNKTLLCEHLTNCFLKGQWPP